MTDLVNMSLDDVIKQNRTNNSRGRGGRSLRRRGGNRGRERGGGPMRPQTTGARRGRSRGWNQSRGRSQSRGRPQSRGRSQSRSRSRSRSHQQRRSISRARSASRSRSQLRSLTPGGRAGLEETIQTNTFNRGGIKSRLRRSNSNANIRTSVHSRLGIKPFRGRANSVNKTTVTARRGIAKQGRGFTTRNRYSNMGLRSDQIIREQHQNLKFNSVMIKSQTFTRSRKNSSSSPSKLTVSVVNDFANRRRNSSGSGDYLNPQSLAELNKQYGDYKHKRGPGSVKSVGSNRSMRSGFSNQSNTTNRSGRGRGRARGRRGNVNHKFQAKQILNLQLQKEIAAIQGKSFGQTSNENDTPSGVNFTPIPVATNQTLHQRFAAA